jgi:hypothetical protein
MIRMEKKVLAYGLFVTLVGVLVILSTLRLEDALRPLSHASTVLVNLLDHIGIAFVSIGIIGIIVDLNDWRKYFQERIAETIIQKSFLERLDKTELINLQTNALKVFFKAENIEREESLLNFLHTKIHGFIGSPYREDFEGRVSIELADEKDAFIVEQTVSYKCRTVGKFIQDEVRWVLQKENDVEGLDEFSISVEIPNNLFQSPEFHASYPKVSQRKLVLDANDQNSSLVLNKNGLGYSYSLADFKTIDELFIEVRVKYRVFRNRDIAWIMSHPTKGFRVTINYPKGLRMDSTILGVDQREYHEKENNGLYFLSYDFWMLPTTGLIFHLWEPTPSPPPPALGNSTAISGI